MKRAWMDRLFGLRRRFSHATEGETSSEAKRPARGPLAINLGIDFGTSFTKVCFRDLGAESTGIVTFSGKSVDDALIPSIVTVGRTGELHLVGQANSGRNAVPVRYLKMKVSGVQVDDPLPVMLGTDLNQAEVLQALCSWFLAGVILRSQLWVLEHESQRIKNREIQWSANIGVPVEHYDSPKIELIREILSVAWDWANAGNIPPDLHAAVSSYKATASGADPRDSDCHAIPEIAAAVQSFLVSREAQPGVYVYFDIGGGTMDGVAFRYLNQGGQKKVFFYSGKVESFGVAVIANDVGARIADSVGDKIVAGGLDRDLKKKLSPWIHRIQCLVAHVIVTAKRKDGSDWQRDAFQDTSSPRRTLARLDTAKMMPLVVFVGGGAAGSKWYQQAILSTYKQFHHGNAGIPPYELAEVPRPTDLDMNGLDPSEFRRFAIAYGLALPFGEGPEIGLPSQISKVDYAHKRQSTRAVDYEDSKDVYE